MRRTWVNRSLRCTRGMSSFGLHAVVLACILAMMLAPEPGRSQAGPPTRNPALREWVSRLFRTNPNFRGFHIRAEAAQTSNQAVSWFGPGVAGGIAPVRKGLFPGFDPSSPAASFIEATRANCRTSRGEFTIGATRQLTVLAHGASSFSAHVSARNSVCRAGNGKTYVEVTYFQPIDNRGVPERDSGFVVLGNSTGAAAVHAALIHFLFAILEAATPACGWQIRAIGARTEADASNCQFTRRQASVAPSGERPSNATVARQLSALARNSNIPQSASNRQPQPTANLSELQREARIGNAKAMNELGNMYFSGRGVARNYGQAFAWYRKAAARGNADGQDNIGDMYFNGLGVARDYGHAMAWYRKAAAQGNAEAENTVGWMYLHGVGVTQDYGQALAWYRKSAAQGNANAETSLGWMYANGRGVPVNYGQAITWYTKAAAQGDATARANLANLGVTRR